MKTFLIKSLLFLILVTSIVSTVLITSGGYVDYFYEKFTTPKAKSLILGDSRSMQGIQPTVINNDLLNQYFELPILNYSFTIAQISYGPLYLESIKKKLDSTSKNGLFIVTVNPWILSKREKDNEQRGVYFEEGMPPHNMNFVNMDPNFEYFFKNFNYFHFKSIIRRTSKMHKDGWLEESNLPKDSVMLNVWKKKQIDLYTNWSKVWKKSVYRLTSLMETINYLKGFGTVTLIRMPIDKHLLQIEENFWNNFDKDILNLAKKTNVKYINFSKDNIYETYDGNHLDKYGGVTFTKNLCDSIRLNLRHLNITK